MLNGINRNYKQWHHHREQLQHYSASDIDNESEENNDDDDDGMHDMFHDLTHSNADYVNRFNDQMRNNPNSQYEETDDPIKGYPISPNKEAAEFIVVA